MIRYPSKLEEFICMVLVYISIILTMIVVTFAVAGAIP